MGLDHGELNLKQMNENAAMCSINSVLTDDGLRAVLAKLKTQNEKNIYGLVCKRWLMLQSSERRRMGVRAGPLMLQRVAARFTSLTELDFTQNASRSFYPGVTDLDLQTVASNFRNLERINLQECKGITDEGIWALAKALPGLKWVVLSDCKKISNAGIEALASACAKLTGLWVARCKLVSDKSMEALGNQCPELEVLDASSCFNITDKGMKSLSQGCSKLQSLNISKCVKVGDEGVLGIARGCSLLRSIKLLDCCKVTDKSVVLIAERCKSIEDVSVKGCRLLSDDGFRVLGRECGHSIRNLELAWCAGLSDDALAFILSQCKLLETLDVENCTKITDQAIDGLTDTGTDMDIGRGWESGLREIKLSHCHHITNIGIGKIAAHCSRLLLLEAHYCPLVSDEGINEMHFPAGCKIVWNNRSLLF